MEEQEINDIKEEWQAPVLYSLQFRKTNGGPEAGTTEDDYNNSPVSGS